MKLKKIKTKKINTEIIKKTEDKENVLIEDLWLLPKIMVMLFSFISITLLSGIALGKILDYVLSNYEGKKLFLILLSFISLIIMVVLYNKFKKILSDDDINSGFSELKYRKALKNKYDILLLKYNYKEMYKIVFAIGIVLSPFFAFYVDNILYFIMKTIAFFVVVILLSFLGKWFSHIKNITFKLMIVFLISAISLIISIFISNITIAHYIFIVTVSIMSFIALYFYITTLIDKGTPIEIISLRLYFLPVFIGIHISIWIIMLLLDDFINGKRR